MTLEVICTKGTTLLIVGKKYQVVELRSYNIDSKRYVRVKGFSYTFPTSNFDLVGKKSWGDFDDFKGPQRIYSDNARENVQKFVKCVVDWNRKLKEGDFYFVEDIVSKGIRYRTDFKIRGFKNTFASYCFEPVPISEQRKIKLNQIKGIKYQVNNERKFLCYTNKQQTMILYQVLAKALSVAIKTDTDGTELVSLMIKIGFKYQLISEDIVNFLEGQKNNLSIYNFNLDVVEKKG